MVMVTTTGLVAQAKYTCSVSTSTYANGWKWMAIGISSSSEAMGNIALISEITSGGGGIRSTCVMSYESSYTSVWSNTWSFTTNFNVNECGIFDSSSGPGGHMFMRHMLTNTKAVANGETLTITLKNVQST
jgi:hypothetical protein